MDSTEQKSPYLAGARLVANRVARLRFLRYLRRSHLAAALVVVLAVVVLRQAAHWRAGEWLVAGLLLAIWLLVGFIFSRWRLPSTAESLLLLDRQGGWKDCFSSAWEFLNSDSRDVGRRLHLSRAEASLDGAVAGFPAALPMPRARLLWIAPLVALALAFSPWGRVPPGFHETKLTEAMREAAALQAEELAREAARLQDDAALGEEERKELEELRAQVELVAETLANPEGLAAGEVLESLEERASAADRLAEKLDGISEEWVSAAMLEEMGRHPDTADLALFLRDKSAEGAAGESMRLHDLLADDEIVADTQERFTRTLESVAGRATDEDKTRPVGERVGNASTKMGIAQPKTAAREFEALAKHFRELAGREEAKKGLERLAEVLREAGGEIGGSELRKMEQLAERTSQGAEGDAASPGLTSLESGAPTPVPTDPPQPSLAAPSPQTAPPVPGTPLARNDPGAKGAEPGQAPGVGEEGEDGEAGQEMLQAPVPGEAPPEGPSGSGVGLSEKARDGKGEGGMLSAPIPGMEPGQSTPGAGLSLGDGKGTQSGQGGDQAGTGTAELVEEASETIKAAGDAEVVALAGEDGESTMRAVEGQAKPERATRSRQEVVADFLAVEEQALDEQSLPLSRRQHVLRYFSGIREQFEKADAGK